MLHLDIESRSHVNLLTDGAYNYARDPSTEIICICYAQDDGKTYDWDPSRPFPEALVCYIASGLPMAAHNAQFERLMFDYVIAND